MQALFLSLSRLPAPVIVILPYKAYKGYTRSASSSCKKIGRMSCGVGALTLQIASHLGLDASRAQKGGVENM